MWVVLYDGAREVEARERVEVCRGLPGSNRRYESSTVLTKLASAVPGRRTMEFLS